METIEHLKHLYRFNEWANRRIIETVREAESKKALSYLSHILITEDEYFERLYGKDSTGFDFWPTLSIDECEALAVKNTSRFRGLLDGFDDEGLGQHARYNTSEGVEFENSFREVLTHVLFHSMNHRGQILTMLRNEGHEPPSIDYIVFERTR